MTQYSTLFSQFGQKIKEGTHKIIGKGKKIISESTSTPIFPQNSASALGPYSPAMDTGEFIFCSGQIALDSDGNFQNESLKSESLQIFKNIDALLLASQTKKINIIKTTVFLSDMNNFSYFNTLYAEYFENHKPARSCVQVVLPKNARVELEVIIKR